MYQIRLSHPLALVDVIPGHHGIVDFFFISSVVFALPRCPSLPNT